VLGGAQSLHTNSFDEALALPSEEAVRYALRTQQIIAHESGVTETIDPLGGSYCVEALTDEMEEGVMAYFDRIESMGGVIPAIERGFFQREIAESAYRHQREVERRERIVVGVNEHVAEERTLPRLLRVSPGVEETQRARLNRLKGGRDGRRVDGALNAIRRCVERDENLMPPIIEAVKAPATLGEICGVLTEMYGEYRELIVF